MIVSGEERKGREGGQKKDADDVSNNLANAKKTAAANKIREPRCDDEETVGTLSFTQV